MAYRTNLTGLVENRYCGVGLYNPKNSFNVGNAIRAVGAFDGKICVVSGNRHNSKGDYRHADTEADSLKIPCFMGVDNLKN